ncbi:hypothetical protein G6F32_014852 [Rhizopus arrhizus]|nr:hypothetical protein G6F32_014852 [Rhizopus arrhizus]
MPVHVGQRGHAEHQHLQPARQPRHGGRQRERDQLVARRGIPQRPGALFVVAHRADDFAERGIQHAQDEGVAQREHGQREVVHRHPAVQVEDAEELAARHALQPVLAAGESCLHRDEVDQLRQRQRDHRKVDALPPDRDGAEQQAQQAARHHAGQQAQLPRRRTPHGRRTAGPHSPPAG